MKGIKIDGPFFRVGIVELLRRGIDRFVVRIHFDSVTNEEFDEAGLRRLLDKYPREWALSYRFAVQCSALSVLVHVVVRWVRRQDREARAGRAEKLEQGTDHLLPNCDPLGRSTRRLYREPLMPSKGRAPRW